MSMMPMLHHRVGLQVNFFSLPTLIVISQGEGSCLHVYDLNSFPSPAAPARSRVCSALICISAGSLLLTDTCTPGVRSPPLPPPPSPAQEVAGHQVTVSGQSASQYEAV